MTMTYYRDDAVEVVRGDCFDPAVVRDCDALIVDAPYSERTHSGHDAAVKNGTEPRHPEGWVRTNGAVDKSIRRRLQYACWTEADVDRFVTAWSPATRGWMVSITDHVLAGRWASAMEAAGRYVFAPLAFTASGSRVRLRGDGPSNWSTWIVVGRPKTAAYVAWGTLPGAYVLPAGQAEMMPVVGGKPEWLMERLVSDYTRPGDLVCDPCLGGGTTLVAAKRLGRRGYGVEAMEEHCAIAAKRLAATKVQERLSFDAPEMKPQPGGLFGAGR